ncbi:hypothetical protein K503DRAFT_56487 [Rhizopogon vinicolor AM-OR11-026]|uniref:Uncharacterized protein n=1 Tax=Rhizopogon vinicolor AM-OR11-026 TaxID=1314800 RepID=A0A1B7MGI2_9AGAM|nr:hypothetical protein K503DRAFT_56487 [Rhizopogon vinicolor AM-OR11-026]
MRSTLQWPSIMHMCHLCAFNSSFGRPPKNAVKRTPFSASSIGCFLSRISTPPTNHLVPNPSTPKNHNQLTHSQLPFRKIQDGMAGFMVLSCFSLRCDSR